MSNAFQQSLRTIARPTLERYGYRYDGKRRFTKIDGKGKQVTIEYQVGVRSANGKFTVNLISDGKLTRLSMIKPTRFAKIVNRVFGEYDPWWKGILLPKDRWWKLSRSQHEMDSILKTTIKELENYGLSWSESDSAT